MSYSLLPGDYVRLAKDYVAPWWGKEPDYARRLAGSRGRVVGVHAHPLGDIVEVRWRHSDNTASFQAKHLRLVKEAR